VAQALEERVIAAQHRRQTEREWTSGEFVRYGVSTESATTDEPEMQADAPGAGGTATEEARVELRVAVVAFVRQLRDSGSPPERAVVQLKLVLSETLRAGQSARAYPHLFDEAMQWGIEAYYTRA